MDFTETFATWRWAVDKDIVTIHGLAEAGKEPWIDTDTRPAWLEKSLFQDSTSRVIGFNFTNGSQDADVLTRSGLDRIATKLLENLSIWRAGEPEESRPLAFVTHDIGGIIFKQAMILASKDEQKYRSILRSIFGVIFIACPHRSLSHALLIDSIAELALSRKYRTKSGIQKTARSAAVAILETNGAFLGTDICLQAQIVNVYDKKLEGLSQLHSQYAATIGLPSEINIGLPHLSPKLSSDKEHILIESLLKNMMGFSQDADWPATKRYPVGQDWNEARSTLISMAPIQVTDRLPNPDAASALVANIELSQWWRDRTSPAACIVGAWTQLIDIIPALRTLSTEIYGSQAKVRFFTFESHPFTGNVDTVHVMLRQFIAQAIGCVLPLTPPEDVPSHVLGILDALQDPNIDILYSLFQDVNVWIARLGLHPFWVACGISHTDNPDWMHRLVQSMSFSDAKPMFLFAGSDSPELRFAADRANVKLLEQVGVELAAPSIPHSDNPGLEDDLEYPEIRAMVEQPLARIGDDETGRTVFLRWIQELISTIPINEWRSQISTISEELLSKGVEGLFPAVLQSLPSYKRDCANDVLRLMLYSFRPLSSSNVMAAMSVEAALGTPVITRNSLEDIPTMIFPLAKRWLSGLVQTKGPRLVFRDDRIRKAFVDTYVADSSQSRSHLRILHQLLEYLSTKLSSLPKDESTATLSGISPEWTARHTFTGYAVHYWGKHYRAAIETEDRKGSAQEMVREFLSNSEAIAFCLTASGRSRASEDILATSDPNASRIALLARNGLSFTEISDLLGTSEWNTDAKLILPALKAAVQRGNSQLVESIPFACLDEVDLKAVLVEAARCEDISTLEILSQKSKGRLPLPEELLSQAARLGLVDVLTGALGNRRKDETTDYAEVFRSAVHCRQTKIVRLLNEFPDVLTSDNVFSLYEDACRVGEVGAAANLHKLLQKDQLVYLSPLDTSCKNGNSDVVKFILGKMNIAKGELLEHEFEGSNAIDALDCLRTALTLGWVRCVDAILDYVDTEKDELRLRQLLGDGIEAKQYDTCDLLLRRTHLNLAEGLGDVPILKKAVRKNDLRLVQLLLDYGAEVDGTDEYEETPLYTAAYAGHTEIAALLLQANADVNARVTNGGSIIYAACMKNKPEMVKLLLSHGADIHLSTYSRNWSPLEAAFDYPEIVELLVKHDPPPDFKRLTVSRTTVRGKTTALFFAISGQHVESVRWILKGDPDLEYRPSPNSGALEGYTPLALAVERGYTSIVRMLLEKGANVNHCIMDERPLLHGATTEETLAVLLEYNVDKEAFDLGSKSTMLSRLVADSGADTDYLPLITRLINAGAKLDPTDSMGDTPLAIASLNGNMELVHLLIARGADVNGNSGRYGRPVHRAILRDNLDSLKALVEKGADIASCHSILGTALQVTCGQDSEARIMEYLVEEMGADPNVKGAIVRNVMLEACLRSAPEAILYLLNHGGLSSSRDGAGMPAIFAACFRSTEALPVIEELLKHGADISSSTRDKMGRTILHCAVASGSAEVVRRVLEKEPTLLSEKDNDGWTALHWAARRAYPFFRREFSGSTTADDWAAVVAYLLEKECPGINMTVSAAEREWTVLSIARYHSAPSQVIDVIVKKMESSKMANPDEYVEGEVNGEGYVWRCDGCYFEIRDTIYICTAETCYEDWGLCFKCYPYRDQIHDSEHEFKAMPIDEFQPR